MREAALADEDAMRIQTIPGIGPIYAAALMAHASEMCAFEQSRDFAAWLGLAPSWHSTGGKMRMGRVASWGSPTCVGFLSAGHRLDIRREEVGSIRTVG